MLSHLTPGPGDQLPLLLPQRGGAGRHLGALVPLEAGALGGPGELLHPVLLLRQQPRPRILGQRHRDLEPASGAVSCG